MTTSAGGGSGSAAAGTRRMHARIVRQMAVVRDLAAALHLEVQAPAVSAWNVAQQLEHLMLVERSVLSVIRRLLDGDPQLGPSPPLNIIGRMVLTSGYIPRGRAQTPAAQVPTAASAAALLDGLPQLDSRLQALVPRLGELERPGGGRVPHPRFGGLRARQWLRFLAIHNHHHLKIVGDIHRARGLGAVALPR